MKIIMNYIYDILLNFNTVAYDFFEWNTTDTITHIRKIPLIKVNPSILSLIENYDVKFENDFLETIKDKTEAFRGKNIYNITYSCLLSDGSSVLAIMYKNNHLMKSRLLIDEEEDVLGICGKMNERNLSITKYKKNIGRNYKTRSQIEKEKSIRKKIHRIYEEKNYEMLKYMYYECFDAKEEDVDYIVKKIDISVNKENDILIKKIQNFLKLIEISH